MAALGAVGGRTPAAQWRGANAAAHPIWEADLTWFRRGADDVQNLALAVVDPAEDLLRRLAINDEKALGMVLTGRARAHVGSELSFKVELLVRLAALLSIGAATQSLRDAVGQASRAGATETEIVEVLVAIGPAIGIASLVVCAPRLALAIGYDLENGHSSPVAEQTPGGRNDDPPGVIS